MSKKLIARFRLWTLLAIVTAIGTALGMWTLHAVRQQKALKALWPTITIIVYWHELSETGTEIGAAPPGPSWIRRIIGDDFFQSVQKISFEPEDDELKYLSDLPSIDTVILDAHNVTDDGLKHLAALRELRSLTVSHGAHLTSRGLGESLQHCPKLEELIINDTPIDRDLLGCLGGLANLKSVLLTRTRITDSDLSALREMRPDVDFWSDGP